MDPLQSVCDVQDLIFQHFSVDELLDLSFVSRSYYKSIGNSNAAMKKVWLNIGDRFNEPNREDLKAFRASERKYQNFKMSEIENGLQILLFPKRQWKRGQVDIQSFVNYRDYVNLLQVFNETIEELEIFDMDIEHVEYRHEPLEFKKLRKLRVGFVTSLAMIPFMQNIGKLRELILEDIRDSNVKGCESSEEIIKKFLKFQPQLTHLSFSADAFKKTFRDSKDFDFKLKYLLVEYSGNSENEESKNLLQNFQSFIESQKNLQWLTLSEWTNVDVIKTVFSSSNINRLSFDYFDGDSKKIDTTSLEITENHSINCIDFECEKLELNWLKVFLKAAPKVETLYFFHVSQEVFEFLLSNLKHLETLKYCSIFNDLDDVYRRMKKESSEIRNVKIEEKKFFDLKNVDNLSQICYWGKAK